MQLKHGEIRVLRPQTAPRAVTTPGRGDHETVREKFMRLLLNQRGFTPARPVMVISGTGHPLLIDRQARNCGLCVVCDIQCRFRHTSRDHHLYAAPASPVCRELDAGDLTSAAKRRRRRVHGTDGPVGQTVKPRARSCSRPSSVILSGPHGGIHTQLIRTSWTSPPSGPPVRAARV